MEDYTGPDWPTQQMHLDDLETGEAAVLELGATKAQHQPGTPSASA